MGIDLLLLSHASAGAPASSASRERARRLDREGRADARLLPEALAGYRIERIVTSSHARCVETVRALALSRGLEIERRAELEPDAVREDTLALLDELPRASLVCTHPELIGRLFGDAISCEPGAAWILERPDGRWRVSTYLPAPTQAVAVGSTVDTVYS